MNVIKGSGFRPLLLTFQPHCEDFEFIFNIKSFLVKFRAKFDENCCLFFVLSLQVHLFFNFFVKYLLFVSQVRSVFIKFHF